MALIKQTNRKQRNEGREKWEKGGYGNDGSRETDGGERVIYELEEKRQTQTLKKKRTQPEKEEKKERNKEQYVRGKKRKKRKRERKREVADTECAQERKEKQSAETPMRIFFFCFIRTTPLFFELVVVTLQREAGGRPKCSPLTDPALRVTALPF